MAMAEEHEVWLLTRGSAAEAIERELVHNPLPALHPVYVDIPRWMNGWISEKRCLRLHYFVWQWSARSVGEALHRRVRFSVGHHVTLASDWMPTGIAWIQDLPLVWGPVGGAAGFPWTLWRWLGVRGFLEEAIREIVTRSARRVFGVSVAKRAHLIAAQNGEVADRFKPFGRVVIEPNVALEPSSHASNPNFVKGLDSESRVALFVGRLEAHKGLRLAIAAIARPEAAGWRLNVYGAGEEADPARRLARRLGVEERVEFLGHRPRAEVIAALQNADALLYPSLHDQAPWAVGEALSSGCPVVCLDWGGPSVLVDQGQGVRVPIQGVPGVAARLAEALGSIESRIQPSARWNRDRLPQLLAHWYSMVLPSRQ
jgi:glycosyltransferase involved in cell wall biosynthesis